MAKKALVVGLNNYPFAPLHGCINDAKQIANVLSRNGDGSPNFHVRLETDEDSSFDKAKLKWLIKELFAHDDTVLFYFSGHGDLNTFGGYIVTPDARQYDEGVSMDEILKVANESPARNKIIILDCCHSGQMGNLSSQGSSTTQIGQGVTILTACRSSEYAVERYGHGLFTGLLLDALEGGAADLSGNVTPGSIYWYVDKALGPWEQRPVFKTCVNEYVPLRTVRPPIPLDTLRKIPALFPDPDYEYRLDPSYEFTEENADPTNVSIFKDLQKMERVGLVVPVGEEHMYYAAVNSKACKLTNLGKCYWRFVKEGRI
jgi:hypothetical protein